MGGRGSGSSGGKNPIANLNGKNSFDKMYGDSKKAENLTTDQLREGYNNNFPNISGASKQQFDFLANYANKNGYQVKIEMHRSMTPSTNGMVLYGSKTIYINPNRTLSQQTKTLAHEIGHSKLHNPNNGRSMSEAMKEMEAEGFAKMVTDNFKMTNDSSKYYIEGWRQRDPNIPNNYLDTNQQYLINTYNDMFGY